jgi:carbamoyltransferase
MNIIGINLQSTIYGLELNDGGTCLMIDGKVHSMIAEERISRKRHDSGYKNSIPLLLGKANLKLKDIDLFVASSCLEKKRTKKSVQLELESNGFKIPLNKIMVCDHHMSHALTAYYPSGFDKALVIVMDGDGNAKCFDKNTTKTNYWKNKFDHQSYYIADSKGVKLLEKDNIPAGENGLGGAYRYFTYFCGFPGNKYAGKLMGLSAYGSKRNTYGDLKLFYLDKNNQIRCTLPDENRFESQLVVEKWFKENNVKIKSQPFSKNTFDESIEDAAWFVQRELQEIIVKKINYLVKKTGIRNICIAGGVGLNAVANQYILENADIDGLFIQPACGDQGQCYGNAIYGALKHNEIIDRKSRVYLGPKYSENEIENALVKFKDKIIFKKKSEDELLLHASNSIKSNKIISWFHGRSEIGPRALGHRSILANPINPKMKLILNKRIKHREHFRPFAPSVLLSESNKWFCLNKEASYMIINSVVKSNKIPAVTHIDNSARVQTVKCGKYERLIKCFQKLTGVPILLNTSFNDNEPIVETPEDAISTFLKTDLDFLYLENYVVRKKLTIGVIGKSLISRNTPTYKKTKKLGQIIAKSNHKLIHGGYCGLMDAVSTGFNEIGSLQDNTGVPMELLDCNKVPRTESTFTTPTKTILERADLLIQKSDCIIVLPKAGIGTLFEALGVFHQNQLNEKFGGRIRPVFFIGFKWRILIHMIFSILGITKQSKGNGFCKYFGSFKDFSTYFNEIF